MPASKSLSVILVVHKNYLPLLKNAVDHLKTNRPHETVIVGNGCIVDIPDTITINCRHTTLGDACNMGIQTARGKYIVRVDADDWVDSELLEQEAQYLDDHPDVDCVWCDYIEFKPHTDGEGYEVYTLEHSPQETLEHACGAMFRKSVWEELDGYDSTLEYQEAYDFWQRFKLAGFKAERLEIPLYLYRKGHASMSTNPQRGIVRRNLEKKYAM